MLEIYVIRVMRSVISDSYILGLRRWYSSVGLRGSQLHGTDDISRINGCRVTSSKGSRNRRWLQLLLFQLIHLYSYKIFPHGTSTII